MKALKRFARRLLGALLGLLAAVIVVFFAVDNRQPVSLSFSPFPYVIEMPLYLFALLMLALGLALSGGISAWRQMSIRRECGAAKRKIAALENEIAGMRLQPGSRAAMLTQER